MTKAAGAALLLTVVAGALLFNNSRAAPPQPAGRHILYYVDPMHPGYRSSQPGLAPDCGMRLVAVYSDTAEQPLDPATSTKTDRIHIDAGTRQLYGIQLAKVEASANHAVIEAYGRVVADDSLIYRVNLGTDGYVKDTHSDAVGDRVTRNQHLAVIYSPEFLSVAGGYLSANERSVPGASKEANAAQSQNTAGAQARADRLRNLGMSDIQIEEISDTRKIPEDIYVVSPANGVVMARNISPGMRFEKHEELYRIADLSRVWVLADVHGTDVAAFRPGAVAHLTMPDTGETFTAHVSNTLPAVDSVTRALQPRLELPNPGYRLRPGMFVDISITEPSQHALTVPTSAIVDTGRAKNVFLQISDGQYATTSVQTGWTDGERTEITHGLRLGDVVVASGTFLVDSESRMHGASVSLTSSTHTQQ